MWVPLSQTSFLHEGNSLLCVRFQLNFGQHGREGVDDCLQGNPAVRRTFLPGGKQWLGTVSPAVIQAVLTLICKVFAAKSNTRGAVLSISDPGVGAHWLWLPELWQPTFYRSAAKQLSMCRSPVGKLHLDYPYLFYKAVGGGGWGGCSPSSYL